MDTGIYVGRRLSFEGHLCTVRYHGSLAGTNGLWLGVEWDDPSRGKHDGNHKGEQVFRCRSESATAASFIRPSRKPDQERTVLEAIKFKYGAGSTVDTPDVDVVVISGKVAEEVGFDKIAKEQAQLAELRIVLVDQLVVNGITPRGSSGDHVSGAQSELLTICPNITELDLGWNTIECWSQVEDVCVALPKLTTLKLGGLRFASLSSSPVPSPLAQIKELHLEDCLLTADDLCDILGAPSAFAQLQELYLSGNSLSTLSPSGNRQLPCNTSVISLVLENNRFTNLDCLVSITKMFPRIKAVSLQANRISKTIQQSDLNRLAYPQIETLNVSHNLIDSYAFIDGLPQLLPSLSSLRISNNPLFEQNELASVNDPRASDKSFYLTLARVPTLTTLNYAKIDARDRQEGEIYYLSVVDKELKAFFSVFANGDKGKAEMEAEAKTLYPQYELLATKYDRMSVIEQFVRPAYVDGQSDTEVLDAQEQIYPPGSLAARLIQATFYLAEATEIGNISIATTLRLPSSLPTTRLMSIILQDPLFQAHLKPLQFNLIYESAELDPVHTTTEGTTKSVVYGRKLTADEKRDLWKEFGEWDADSIIDDAFQKDSDSPRRNTRENSREITMEEHWTEDGKFLIREGRKWKRREVEIPHALKRPWGDWLEDAKEVRIRVEPFERTKWGT